MNFSRLYFYAISLLGYTRREARFLTVIEICSQYEEYCLFNNIELGREMTEDEMIDEVE